MVSPSGEYAESRPFKIFISLLDKWEIGAPLTEVLIYDALKAAKHLKEHPVDSSEDVREQICHPVCQLTRKGDRSRQRQAHYTKRSSHSSRGSI